MIRRVSLAIAVVIAATLPVLTGGVSAFAQERDCLSDRQIYSAVEQGELPPLEDVLRANGVDRSTQVLSVQVCEDDGGGLAYFVGVLNASGEARTLVLPALQ
jgi:hypothetical protein